MNLLIIFLTGLTTGGLACLAVQGGLLASVIANQKEQEHENKSFNHLDWQPVIMFLTTKLVAHTILGFLLGLLGSAITLSLGLKLGFQVFTAIFMIATAMNLLDVHPIFRYLAFQPPKFLQRLIRNTGKSKALFAPAVLGLMTVFIPCGVTQAMEVLAVNSGSPIEGALIMLAFVLGTSPLFALLGVATAKLSESWYKKFTKLAASVLIVMAIYSLNGMLLVINSPVTINKIIKPITYFFSDERFENLSMAKTVNGVQQVTINVLSRGYNPNYVKVKRGIPVELTIQSEGVYSCALSFVLKEFGIRANLGSTDLQTFSFTPDKQGKFVFSCSMGMYSGTLEVI